MDDARSTKLAQRAFGDTAAILDDQYAAYRKLYAGAETIKLSVNIEDYESFRYCVARKYFVLVVPYTEHHQVIVERTFVKDQLGWVLLGGSVRHDRGETFLGAVIRHASRVLENIQLGEIEPIAFLENCFTYEGQTHTHLGVAFDARVRNPGIGSAIQKTIFSRGHLLRLDQTGTRFELTHNAQVMEIARRRIPRVWENVPSRI